MFGSNKEKQVVSSSGGGASLSHNSLVHGTKIKGDVYSESDIRIDGEVEGSIQCQAKLVLGPRAIIKGKIVCRNARIEGRVEGNVNVTEVLDLRKTAFIQGDILTKKLIIEEGAVFNGSCQMQKQVTHGGTRQSQGGKQGKQKAS